MQKAHCTSCNCGAEKKLKGTVMLDKMLEVLKPKEADINKVLFDLPSRKDEPGVREFVENSRLVVNGQMQVTVFSLIATITEMLTGKRLGWAVDSEGTVTKTVWTKLADKPISFDD
jgi:hypothetical protein